MKQYKNQYEGWAKEDLDLLRENYQTKGLSWCLENIKVKRSASAVQYQANHVLNIKRLPAWSQENINIIREKYHIMSAKELSVETGKTENAIRQMAMKLGINCINYKEWTQQEESILLENYTCLKKKEILKLFPDRDWENIKAKANKLNIKRETKGMDLILGDVSPLLDENNLISAYWLGFLLADGHFSSLNRIVLGLAAQDREHVYKFGEFLKTTGKIREDALKVTLSIMDNFNVAKIKDKYDIKNDKTYHPPKLEVFQKMSNDFFISMLIGFIDGDGTIQDRKITKVKFVGIKCHSSWLQILNLFIERLSDQVGVKIPVGKINARGYARVFITNNIHIKYLKNKAIEFNLPILTRKWDKIDLNFVSKQEYTPILNKKIKELSSAGMKNNLIAKELQVSESTVSNHLKIQN